MKRKPPSSSISWPAGFHFVAGSVNSGGRSSLARFGEGELAGEGEGGFAEAYSFKSSSHRARRSWRSWFGLLRFRAGAGVLGVHVTFACNKGAARWLASLSRSWEGGLRAVQVGAGRAEQRRASASLAWTYLYAIGAGEIPVALYLTVLAEDTCEDARRLLRDVGSGTRACACACARALCRGGHRGGRGRSG